VAKFSTLPVRRDGRVQFIPPTGVGTEWPPVARWGWEHWACWLGQHGWTEAESREYYFHDRFTYGFGLRRNTNEEFKWFYNPVPRAVEFHACKTPNILYGGAVGGTKSTTARWDAYRQCWAIPEFTAIIMRRTHQELKRNHMKFVARESKKINDFLGKEVMEWVPTEFELRFKHNGSVILFGHCQNPGDEEKYLSDEYDAFYPDEMATFLKDQIMGVQSRLRSVVRDNLRIIPRMGGTSNPGGANTLWCVDYFINRTLPEEELIDNPRYDPTDWTYIHARLYDNPYIMDPDGTYTTYEKRVYARGGARAKQLIAGDWSAITGQYFEELADTHFGRLEIPPGCRVERWVDWGYSKPGYCCWAAILPSGRIYIFHEYPFRKTLASNVAKYINRETYDHVFTKYRGLTLGTSIGDPAMWSIDGQTGESYAETFARHGVALVEGDHQRVLGWGRFREWLAIAPDGLPWLVIDPACRYARRTLPSLIVDKTNPEDVDSDGEDHAADAIRYGLMGRPAPAPGSLSPTPPLPDSIRALINQATQSPAERSIGKVA
jgi:hypothetical protein